MLALLPAQNRKWIDYILYSIHFFTSSTLLKIKEAYQILAILSKKAVQYKLLLKGSLILAL